MRTMLVVAFVFRMRGVVVAQAFVLCETRESGSRIAFVIFHISLLFTSAKVLIFRDSVPNYAPNMLQKIYFCIFATE